METYSNSNMFGRHENNAVISATVSTPNPISSNNTLYDSLPVNDSVIFENVTDNASNEIKDVCQNNIQTKLDGNTQSSNALSQIQDYGMSDSEDSSSDSDEIISDSETHSDNDVTTKPNEPLVINTTNFRVTVSSSDNSSTSEYESDSSSSFSDIGACAPAPEPKRTDKMTPPRTKGELSLEELPPIEELKITVPEEDCIEIGTVTSIIDQLVIVQSHRGTAAYDIDTLFFLNRGKNPLGRVFDVLGPVTEPLYAVRFNSYEQALETGVKIGTPVYCAPRTQHTSYVFVSELMKIKGSDASWEHNNEPPEVFLDYSDDEEERRARRLLRKKTTITDANKSNSLERNKKFEQQMNDKNLLMNERFKNQTNQIRKKKPETRAVLVPPTVGPQPPPAWLLPTAPMTRPDFWQAPPYQFAAYPPYGPMVFPPRQPFVPPMMAPAPPPAVFQPFNPNIPPPIMRPQPVSYFHKPRHPPWVPPPLNVGVNVLQPRANFGNGSSYTQ